MKTALLEDIFRLHESVEYELSPTRYHVIEAFSKLSENDPLLKLYIGVWHITRGRGLEERMKQAAVLALPEISDDEDFECG